MRTIVIISAFCFLTVWGAPETIPTEVEAPLEVHVPIHDEAETKAVEDGVAASPTPSESDFEVMYRMTEQGAEPERSRLFNDLINVKKYNKLINPDNVKVDFGMNLIDFNVREDKNALDSYVWLKYSWVDSRLQWTPEEYGGVQVLRIHPSVVWKPDITLYNSADPVNMINCWDTNTLIYPTGKVVFIPPCKMLSACKLTLKKEPFGEQTCSTKFGSWTFDGNVMDLQFYNGTKGIDTTHMHNSSGFEVVSTTAQRNVKYYECCPAPYTDLTFNITIKRVPAAELFYRL